jgi:hypothetical protein
MTMDARLIRFGLIEINGHRYEHDVVIDGGVVYRRRKSASKAYRVRYGHTPVSLDEAIPWAARRLIIGTGVSGQLPIMPELYEEARRRGVEIVAEPTALACRLLQAADAGDVAAILHVTC